MNAIDKRAIVIGGSLAGLFAGTLLRSIGWQVDIYERSTHTLDSRGGGIVLQPPDVMEAFQRAGVAYEAPLGVVAHERSFQKLVAATQEPFVQTILDLGVPQTALP